MKKVFVTIKYTVVTLIIALGLLIGASALPIPGNYSVYTVLSGSMEPAIHTGSIVIVKPQSDYADGEIITAKSGDPKRPVTHRIVEVIQKSEEEGGAKEFITKGDANEEKDATARSMRDVLGKVSFSIPFIGYLIGWAQTPTGFIAMIVIPGVLIAYHEVLRIVSEVQNKYKARRKKKSDKNEGEKKE